MSGGGGIGTSSTSGGGATGAKQHPRLAVGQLCSTSDPDYNLAECTAIAKAAKSQGAAFLSLPECFAFMGTPGMKAINAQTHCETYLESRGPQG
jgi:predicted amidohydrolase